MTPRDPVTTGLLRDAAGCVRAGRFAQAEGLLRQALDRQTGDADVQFALGVALARQGRLAEAAPHLRQAVQIAPENPEHWKTALDVSQALGDLDGQARLYRELLRLQPGNPAFHYKHGNVLRDMGRMTEAQDAWRAALAVDPNFAPAHVNLGVAAKMRRDLKSAEQSFRTAVRLMPASAAAHRNLGTVLEQLGDLAGAEQAYRQAMARAPEDVDTPRFLGAVLCEQGRLDEALEIFRAHARRRYGPGTPPAGPVPQHKQDHDREQQVWLGRSDVQTLSILGGERLTGPVISAPRDRTIEATWQETHPPIVVIDDFLTPAALEELRRFCLGSTIWREAFPGGYLGALPEHGFAAPLLAQLAEELAAGYPGIFKGHPLLQLWAFKYGKTPTGIRLHADFAAVNVNFWITPDSANRDPDRGGLVIWDKAAPQDWNFEKYNNDEAAIRAFLQHSGARPRTVPYRANRAVIFDSDLFHETDVIDFAPGYENRRINITLLFGWRGGARRTG